MALPTLLHPGVLPPGVHPASLTEIDETFVSGAQNYRRDREVIMMALRVWVRRMRQSVGTGTTWLSGTFVTDLVSKPTLKIAYFPDNKNAAVASIKTGLGLPLFTIRDVMYMQPDPGGHAQSVSAVGGLVDAYIADEALADLWEVTWSVPWASPVPGVTELGLVSVGDMT